MHLTERILLRAVSYYTQRAFRKGDWRRVPINECGERLVEVPEIFCAPYYAVELSLTKDRRIFVRQQVLFRFLDAQRIANASGYDIMIYDGWRSLALQKTLYWSCMAEYTAPRFNVVSAFDDLVHPEDICTAFNALHPELQGRMHEANQTYSSLPSKDALRPSPHATGGAIDVWLYRDGRRCDLGVAFDEMTEAAGAFYHLGFNREPFNGDDAEVVRNRAHLLLAMTGAGFVSLPSEIWHFNCGNQMAALVRGRTARYGYTEPPEDA
jgi:D-alanyl-D-alanine dipeptidase